MLHTDDTNEGEGQPTDDAAQDKGKEQGEVIGQAEIVEEQAGTSGDLLGAVRVNVEVQNEEEEEDDKDEEEDEEEDEDDPDVDKEEYLKQIKRQGKVSKVSSGSVLAEGSPSGSLIFMLCRLLCRRGNNLNELQQLRDLMWMKRTRQ